MPRLTMMMGIPGSGKTTLRNKIVKRMEQMRLKPVVVSSDDIIEETGKLHGLTYDEVYNNAELAKTCYEKFNYEFDELIKIGRNVVVDRTSVHIGARMSLLKRVPCFYSIHYHVIMPPRDAAEADELVRRLRNRPGKSIPDEVMLDFVNKFEIPQLQNEPLDSIVTYDIFGNEVERLFYKKVAA